MFFSRVPYARNGVCPRSHLGSAINSARGFPVSAASFSQVKSKFHRANDQTKDSYAAVLRWVAYARRYLYQKAAGQAPNLGEENQVPPIP